MVKVNGESVDVSGITIDEYLDKTLFDIMRIAVECNEEFVPKHRYSEYVLSDGDALEIVSFVGGG